MASRLLWIVQQRGRGGAHVRKPLCVYSACELSTASTGYSTASAGAEPKPKGKRIQMKSFKAMLRKERRVREDGILEVLRWNATASANLQQEASESGGACQRRHGDEGRPQEQAGKGQDEMRRRPPQCHGNDGHGHQPAPPQGASDKTSGSISTSVPSSASPSTPSEPPATHGPATVPGLSQRHGNGGRGSTQLRRRVRAAKMSDKHVSMHS